MKCTNYRTVIVYVKHENKKYKQKEPSDYRKSEQRKRCSFENHGGKKVFTDLTHFTYPKMSGKKKHWLNLLLHF